MPNETTLKITVKNHSLFKQEFLLASVFEAGLAGEAI